MATRQIPVRNGLNAYSMSVELDGTYYTFAFRWNARSGHWFMSVGTTLQGIKLVNSVDLIGQFDYKLDPELPPGTLRVVDTAGLFRDPDTETLGNSVLLLYDEAS